MRGTQDNISSLLSCVILHVLASFPQDSNIIIWYESLQINFLVINTLVLTLNNVLLNKGILTLVANRYVKYLKAE